MIALDAVHDGFDLSQTWSCYKGDDIHCGRCGTCVERLEAISWAIHTARLATGTEYEDKTEYEDSTFWNEVV